jgi:hypothetical protein
MDAVVALIAGCVTGRGVVVGGSFARLIKPRVFDLMLGSDGLHSRELWYEEVCETLGLSV